jgi:hypothetical protein
VLPPLLDHLLRMLDPLRRRHPHDPGLDAALGYVPIGKHAEMPRKIGQRRLLVVKLQTDAPMQPASFINHLIDAELLDRSCTVPVEPMQVERLALLRPIVPHVREADLGKLCHNTVGSNLAPP